MPKGARKAAAEAAAAKLVEAAEVEAEALGARYTVAQAIEWGKKHYGDDEGWDEACWEAWALARSDVDKDEVTSSASLSLLAAAEAARPPSPTQSDLAMLAAADAMDAPALDVVLSFGCHSGKTLRAIHIEDPGWLRFVVDKQIYLKTCGKPLVPGLKLLGFLTADTSQAYTTKPTVPANVTVSTASTASSSPSWEVALLAGTLAEVKIILEQMKRAPLAAAPALLDRALLKVAPY